MTIDKSKPSGACAVPARVARPAARRRRLVTKFLLLAISVGFSFVLAEVFLRIAVPQPKSWLDIYQSRAGSRSYGLQSDAQRVVSTGEAIWTVTTDGQGHRKCGVGARPDTAPTALVLGDSFTFGEGVSDDDTFVARLAARSDTQFRFVNAGVSGYGPVQYRMVLEDWLAAKNPCPQVTIIVVFTGNDFHDCIWSKNTPVVNGVLGDTGGLRSWLKRNLHLYRGASKIWQGSGLGGNDQRAAQYRILMNNPEEWEKPPLLDAWPIFCAEIKRIAEICRSNGGNVLGVIIPSRDLVELPTTTASIPTERAAGAFNAAKTRFIDTTTALRHLGPSKAYLRYNGHLTPEGNAAVAEAIAPFIQDSSTSIPVTSTP